MIRRLGHAIALAAIMPALAPWTALEIEYEHLGRPRPKTWWGRNGARASRLTWFCVGWKTYARKEVA